MVDLKNIRRDYTLMEMSESSVSPDPFLQFAAWFKEATAMDRTDPTAMVLSTVSADYRPSSRVVLLKHFSELGFVFFTNYQSKKGKELETTPYASLLFFWPEMERQVRIEGKVHPASEKESDEYFMSRPVESQVGAWASPQSTVIPNRKTLIDWYEEFESIFKTSGISRPPHWGGYLLEPDLFEFWQGRENRLHDRIEYTKEQGGWGFHRLAP